ncbi:MAG: hypothetical protein WBG15_06670 [Xanthobacteraceae bacterium]
MFRPDGAHLRVRRKFTAIRLRKRFFERGSLFGAQFKDGLIFPCQLQKHSGEIILHFRREAAHSLESLFQQFGHLQKIDLSPAVRKDFRRAFMPRWPVNKPQTLWDCSGKSCGQNP